MKYLIVVLTALVAFVAADEEWKPISNDAALLKIREDCIKESGLTKAQIDQIRNVELLDEKEFHEFILCHGKKLGVFTEEGGYNVDRVLAHLSALHEVTEQTRVAVEKCAKSENEENITPAVRAYRGAVCLIKNNVDKLPQKSN